MDPDQAESPMRKTEPDSWLLRLFESDFFNSRLALSYLFRYPTNVGIHDYVCKELRKYPEHEILFLLPQICHIMVSRPKDSAALEDFAVWMCQKSQHLALLTLWYLETYLSDFETTLTANSESYTLCYRLYTKCQTIVFAETAVDLSQPDVLRVSIAETKISKNARIAPMIVGLGVVLGSVGSPIAFQAAEKVIHVQVRQPRHQAFMEIIDTDDDSGNPQELTPEQIKKSNRRDSFLSKILARVPSNSPTVEELNRGNAFSFNNFVQKTRKKSKKLARKTPSNESFKVLPQSSGDLTSRESRAKSFDRNTIPDDSDNHQLLNPHYFHSEIQFIMALVDISERLVSSPKPSRQSSLLAELTLLNHNLPANVCLPFWCPAEYNEQKHHQIARIALTDCVVLNSAERVPFLICVEVIENGRHMGSSNFLSPHTQKRDSESRRNSTVYFNGVVSRRESYMERRKSAEVQSRLERADTGLSYMSQDYEAEEFREKMRTAAVMLAQLYQQQQRGVESAAIKSYSRFRSISATAASYIYPKSATAASYIYPKSATGDKPSSLPPSPSAADRVQQKLKSEFEEIRAKVIKEMALSEAARLEALQKRLPDDIDTTVGVLEKLAPEEEEDLHHGTFHQSSDDPSASVFFESWAMKKERIRQSSPYGQNDKWDLFAVIVKSGADLRQEQLALQTIKEIQSCWESLSIPLWVYPFRMLITSADSGLVEVIPDSVSIHSIKKAGYMKRLNTPGIVYSLYDHFIHTFGPAGSERFQTAQENFIRSLAGYSLICYLLQIKDRHNGNILMSLTGHLAHIDFGFMLMNSPGSVGFELAPFKMPQEYIDILGGMNSERFGYFRSLFKMGMLGLRKRSENIIGIIEIMERDSRLPCFTGANKSGGSALSSDKLPVTAALRERFQLHLTDEALCANLDKLIDSSCNNMFTKLYDSFQYYANGIL